MENLYGNFWWFTGVVEDINDPKKLGRLRVRIMGYHTDDIGLIKTNELPWANVMQPITSAANSGIGESPTGILRGTHVVGFFRDGKSAQLPIIMGTIAGIPEKKAVPGKGFFDPTEQYPLKANENDVPLLARNDGDVPANVTTKKSNIDSASNWTEPETPYNSQYPKNNVKVTESGHIEEFDDTPGSERINREHKSGTFEEWHPNGDSVRKIKGNNYEIIAGDDNVLVKGNCNLTIEGNLNVKVQGNYTIEANGIITMKAPLILIN